MAVRAINASRFAEILEQWKKDCLQDNDQQSADVISDVILQLDDMPTLTPPNEWVSVEERLPNDKQIVLFRQKNGFIYCAEYFAGNSLCSPSWFIDCDCWEAKEVTHWMPLPTPPDRRPPEVQS